MKRFIAAILSLLMIFGCVVSLSGCSKTNNQGVTLGQWLSMINEAFGMNSYVQDEPYYSSVDANNEFFEEVQIAREWDVISASMEIDTDSNITWKDALISLVNAGNFSAVNSSEEEKINCAINKLDSSIRKYWINRTIKYSDAVMLLASAQRLWANQTYEERVEEVKFKEGVKDLSKNENITQNYYISDDTTVLPDTSEIELEVGDIYILPSNDNSVGTKVYRAENIKKENGQIQIKNSTDIDLYDIAEDIFLQETIIPTAQNTVIYDAGGNILSNNAVNGVSQNDSSELEGVSLVATDANTTVQRLAASKMKHEFKIGEWKVALSYKLDDALDIEATVGKSLGDDDWEWEVGLGLDNVKVTNEIDYKWFKLNSASVRVDYDTKLSFKASAEEKVVNKVAAPYNNGNGKGLTNLKKAVLKDAKKAGGNGAQTIKLFSMDVWSVGVARVCLDVNFVVKVDGTFEIKITNHDSKGIEYKNNNIRFINTSDKDIDISAKAKIEATLGIGPALYTVGLKKPIIGVQGKFGAGASAGIVLHLADSEDHLIEEASAEDYPPEVYRTLMEADITTDADSIRRAAEAQGGTYSTETSGNLKLHTDVCIDIAMYWIIRLEVTDSSYAADLLGGKIKLSKEFLGEKNGKFGYAHIEDFDFIAGFSNAVFGSTASKADLCTKKYKPFDNAIENTEKDDLQNNGDMILKGDQIVLSEMRANIAIGQKYYVIVQQLPKGYNVEDLRTDIANTRIATVDENGAVVGNEAGSTIITVHTVDNKFSAYCAIVVTDSSQVDFKPLGTPI